MKNMTWQQKTRLAIPWLVLSCYWIFIFTLTHMPSLPIEGKGSDKLAHFGAYFVLTLIFWWTCFGRKPLRFNSRKPYFTILTIAFYGAVDELSQKFIPGRHCDFYDWLFDVAGMLTALILILFLRKLIYWFILCFAVFFTLVHFYEQLPLFKLTGKPGEMKLVYIMVAFTVMTILFWRSFCPEKFIANKLITGLTIFAMFSLAFISEIFRLATTQTFVFAYVGASILGIIFAIIFCSLMAKHAETEEEYKQFPPDYHNEQNRI